MTRKEILFRENITLWNEYHTLTGAATTDLDEYAQTYKYQKALKESRAFDLEQANESLRQKIEKAKAEKEHAAKVEAFYQTPEGIRLMAELDAQELAAIVEFKETDEAMRSELQGFIHRTLGDYWTLETFGPTCVSFAIAKPGEDKGTVFGQTIEIFYERNSWFTGKDRFEVSVGSTGSFEALSANQGDRARFYIDLGKFLADQQGLQQLRDRLYEHADKMDQIRARIKAVQDRKDNPFEA
ncbi:MAG: hypothetical protein SOX36_03245 [Candidatus Cryptobacteroides sp.]|nr:hypothetical protein [Candidatus Cryptobacteroides sp.]